MYNKSKSNDLNLFVEQGRYSYTAIITIFNFCKYFHGATRLLLLPGSSTVLTYCSPKLTSELIRSFQAVDTGSPDTPLEVFG
ncbi:UNVERIFIED_CONTAM: hypothetical protein NCL1_07310 [Trichonephila clavipes]